MKKTILSLFACLLSYCTFAQNEGHFSLRLTDQNIAIENITNYFPKLFDLDKNTTFLVTLDTIDDIGMRHKYFQQYYNGVKVENGVINVHAKDGIVTTVNGEIMESYYTLDTQNSLLKSSTDDKAEYMIVPINTEKGVIYKTAYKIFDKETNTDIYIDSEKGDTIKRISRIFTDMVDGAAYTMYNGWKPMSSYYSNGQYTLYDEDRQIMTLDASSATWTGEVTSYRDNSNLYYSTTADWGCILSSITITADDGKWWYTAITDTRPDYYIKIYDSQDNLLYVSETIDNQKVPVEFNNINIIIDDGSYIEIYDEDAINDTYGGAVTISSNEPGNTKWNGTYTSGKITKVVNPALDAHWGMQHVYDFYKEKFNRASYNSKGSMIYQFIDPYGIYYDHQLANAFASYDNNGTGFMCYGLGDNESMTAVVALDVMAHEFTHMVTEFNGRDGLDYIGESGALNESFSDIFATAIEFYTKGEDANWLIGEDVMLEYSNMRSMSDPKSSMDGVISTKEELRDIILTFYDEEYYNELPDTLQKPLPDTYKGEFWSNTSDNSEYGDNGGVHTNSGVQNKWFYLLSEGGSGTNDNGDNYLVTGIGIEKAQRIAYRNLVFYLPADASYWDARNESLNAAIDLFGENSQEYKSVDAAWYAVGLGSIGENSSRFVVNVEANDKNYGQVLGSGVYLLNETAHLIAQPNNGYKFVKWNDGNTDNPRQITVSQDTTFKAFFEYAPETAIKKITLYSNNMQWGSVSGDGEYLVGEQILISANPEEGYRFVQWSDGNKKQNRYITIEDDVMLIATFETIDESAIPSIQSNVLVYSTTNTILIENAENSFVSVIDLQGKTVIPTQKITQQKQSIKVPQGLYVVKIDNMSFEIFVQN